MDHELSSRALWNAIQPVAEKTCSIDTLKAVLASEAGWLRRYTSRNHDFDEYFSLFAIELLTASKDKSRIPLKSTEFARAAWRARYRIVQALREQQRRVSLQPELAATRDTADAKSSPNQVDLRQRLHAIVRLSKSFAPRDLVVLEMLLDGYPNQRIAQVLEMSPSLVRVVKWRLIQKLRELISDSMGSRDELPHVPGSGVDERQAAGEQGFGELSEGE